MIIKPILNPVAFKILNIPIHWYGLIMAFAIFVGILLSSYVAKKKFSKDEYNKYIDILPNIIIFSFLGARLFYVIGDWSFYSNNLSEIIMINHGGLSIYGGIIFGLLALFIYSKINKFELLKFCDCIAIVIPLCQSIGRWGNFINQEAYGMPYNGFLKMFVSISHRFAQYKNVEYYHPTFLYESVLDFLLFIILFSLNMRFQNAKKGTFLFLYLILYSIIRIFVENIRIDSVSYIFNIPVAICIAAIVIILSLASIIALYYKKS